MATYEETGWLFPALVWESIDLRSPVRQWHEANIGSGVADAAFNPNLGGGGIVDLERVPDAPAVWRGARKKI